MSDEREWVAIHQPDGACIAIVDSRYVRAFRKGAGMTDTVLRGMDAKFKPPVAKDLEDAAEADAADEAVKADADGPGAPTLDPVQVRSARAAEADETKPKAKK